MEKKEMILKFIKDKSYVPMKRKEIAQVLMVPKEEQEELKNILDELETEYKIRKNRKNKYIIMDDKYVEGTFRANQKGFGFVDIQDGEDIHISSENINDALNGDTVLVKILDTSLNEKSKEGKIVKIIKRDLEKIVGTFQNTHKKEKMQKVKL